MAIIGWLPIFKDRFDIFCTHGSAEFINAAVIKNLKLTFFIVFRVVVTTTVVRLSMLILLMPSPAMPFL